MIKDCFYCCLASMVLGVVVGGVMVISNKKIENKFRQGTELATEKIEELQEKIEETKSKKSKVH